MDLEKAYNKIDNFCCSNHNTLQGNKVRYLNNREETINMFSDYQETKDNDFCKDVNEMIDALDTIKEVIDSQKELDCSLKVLKIIFKKGLPLSEQDIIRQSKDYNEYCIKWSWLGKTTGIAIQKTQEEFDLIKRFLSNE